MVTLLRLRPFEFWSCDWGGGQLQVQSHGVARPNSSGRMTIKTTLPRDAPYSNFGFWAMDPASARTWRKVRQVERMDSWTIRLQSGAVDDSTSTEALTIEMKCASVISAYIVRNGNSQQSHKNGVSQSQSTVWAPIAGQGAMPSSVVERTAGRDECIVVRRNDHSHPWSQCLVSGRSAERDIKITWELRRESSNGKTSDIGEYLSR